MRDFISDSLALVVLDERPPMHPALHPEIVRYLTRHRATVAAEKRAIHDGLLLVNRILTRARHLALDLRTDLNEAEYAAHNHALDHRMTFMHTRIEEIDVAARDVDTAMQRLARALRAVETSHDTDPDVLARLIECNPPA